jgi:PAS domain S-box-containing protein
VAFVIEWVFYSAVAAVVWFPFFLGLTLAACLGGFRATVVVSAVTAIAVFYAFAPPRFEWAGQPHDFIVLGALPLNSCFLAFLVDRLRRANEGLATSNKLQKSVAAELHRSRERLDQALKGADLAAWEWNVQTGEFVHNARWAELRGYHPGELPLRVESWFVGIHPDDMPQVKRALSAHLEGRSPDYNIQIRVAAKDGRWVWILQRGKVYARDERGQPLRMAGTSLDITEQKRTEIEQHFLTRIGLDLGKMLVVDDTLSALAEVVVKDLADYCVIDLVEESGEIRRAKVACSVQAKSALLEEFARLSLGSQRTPILLQVLQGGGTLLFETVVPKDLEIWARNEEHLRLLRASEVCSLLWVPLVGRDRILGGFCLASASRTRKYQQDDLRFAEQLARVASLSVDNARLYTASRRASDARDEVLAVVAHDLRNPLGTILLQAGLLRRQLDRPENPASRAIERIGYAALRMNRLIKDLLDVTCLEAGQLKLERAPHPMQEVVAEAVEEERALATAASVEIRIDTPEHLPDVYADRDRVLQVFENLIGNALKFTPAGGYITVGAVPHGGFVLCSVQDTGRGISIEDQPHLFDRFWLSHWNRPERGTSAGLGLAIVKGIVEAHGGRVWVASTPGKGSTFYFALPTNATKEIGYGPAAPGP